MIGCVGRAIQMARYYFLCWASTGSMCYNDAIIQMERTRRTTLSYSSKSNFRVTLNVHNAFSSPLCASANFTCARWALNDLSLRTDVMCEEYRVLQKAAIIQRVQKKKKSRAIIQI